MELFSPYQFLCFTSSFYFHILIFSNQLFVELLPILSTVQPITHTHPMLTRYQLCQNPVHISNIDSLHHALVSLMSPFPKPKSLKTTLKQLKWTQVMKEELFALHQNQMWELVPWIAKVNVTRSKWAFRIKLNKDGTLDIYIYIYLKPS